MARILITGGAGYVGSHTAKALADAGHEGVIFDNLSRGHAEFARWGPLIEGDIRDKEALGAVFRQYRIDAVMHFAALAYVGESVGQPDIYYDVNVNGARILLDAMRRAGVEKIVFSSSCAVYGEPDCAAIEENTSLAPVNPYGFTKLVCERMMADYGQVYGLRSVSLRYFNAAGADPDGEIGEWHEPETHLIPLILDAALGRREAISVFGDDYDTADGSAIRDYIHVSDLANAHVKALEHLLAGGNSTAVNLGTGHGASVFEVIDVVRKVTGKAVRVAIAPRRPGDPPQLVASPTRAAALLDWSCRYKLDEAIEHAWRWHVRRFGGDDA